MCIEEERLELYVLGRLSEPEAEVLEDHLLLCERCQNRADQLRVNAEAIRTAMSERAATDSGKLTSISGARIAKSFANSNEPPRACPTVVDPIPGLPSNSDS
jgi:anti-sigma factor RsiW